jgi:hypothetical protein
MLYHTNRIIYHTISIITQNIIILKCRFAKKPPVKKNRLSQIDLKCFFSESPSKLVVCQIFRSFGYSLTDWHRVKDSVRSSFFHFFKYCLYNIADIVLTLEMIFMQIGCNLEILDKDLFLEILTYFLPPLGQNQIFWSK